MKRCIRALTFVFSVAVFAGCVTNTPYQLVVLSPSDIHERVDTVAMLPLQVENFDRKEEVSARYEALITEQLETAGFKVIPSREYSDIRKGLTDEVGNLYDPQTGEANQEKLDVVWTNSLLRLAEQFNTQAYILPKIVRVGAHWSSNTTSWDGVERPTAGETEGFWERLAVTPDGYGTIPAMSLRIELSSMSGETYFIGRGGIQVTSQFRSGQFVDVPQSNWFVNEDWDVEAVKLALIPLTGDLGSASAAISLKVDISLPRSFDKVFYRPTIDYQGMWVHTDLVTLTVNDNSLEFAGKKENLSILLTEIQKLSIGYIGADGVNKWVVIEYGANDSPSYAVMAPRRGIIGAAAVSDEIFSTITYVIKKNNLTVPIGPH